MTEMILSVIFTVVTATAAVSTSGAQFPAGLDPALCPNYPHCNNALLASAIHGSQYDGLYDVGNHVSHYDNGKYDDGSYNSRYDDGSYNGRYDDGSYNGRYDDGSYNSRYDDGGHYDDSGRSYGSAGYRQQPSHLQQYGAVSGHLGSLLTEPGYPVGLTSADCPNYPYCSHKVRSFQPIGAQNSWYPFVNAIGH